MLGVRAGGCGLGLWAAVGTLLLTATISAQTTGGASIYLKNNSEGIVRGPSYDANWLFLNQFNRQNCTDDEVVTFNIDIRGGQAATGTYHLEGWVGTACDDLANRSSGLCTEVGVVGQSVERMQLSVRDLVRSTATSDAEPCASEDELPTSRTVYFMLVDNDGEPPAGSSWVVKWAYKYDLVPPTAPTKVQASAIEGGLHVTWEQPDATADLRRYAFLCDPPPQSDPADGLGPNEFCESRRLGSGETPTREQLSTFMFGYTEEIATGADLTPLTPDFTYAVGVVALDSFYNFSPVSDTACGVPYPPLENAHTHTVLTNRGCAIGGARDGSSAAWLVVGGALGLARRRRGRTLVD